MIIYLAGVFPMARSLDLRELIKKNKPSVLESFYYIKSEDLIPYCKNFLLDSGAFTFMANSNIRVDWYEYTEKYADFINRNNVKNFFELDIDSIIGYDETLRLRKFLETKTGKKCIPVWHPSRGINEFLKMCDEYKYVSLGGIAGKEWKNNTEKFIPWFINEAHKRGTKIHGLGFTKINKLSECHFDSVDSTSWIGGRFGIVYIFNNRKLSKKDIPVGKRLKSTKDVDYHNYKQWIEFQKWAEVNL